VVFQHEIVVQQNRVETLNQKQKCVCIVIVIFIFYKSKDYIDAVTITKTLQGQCTKT